MLKATVLRQKINYVEKAKKVITIVIFFTVMRNKSHGI